MNSVNRVQYRIKALNSERFFDILKMWLPSGNFPLRFGVVSDSWLARKGASSGNVEVVPILRLASVNRATA